MVASSTVFAILALVVSQDVTQAFTSSSRSLGGRSLHVEYLRRPSNPFRDVSRVSLRVASDVTSAASTTSETEPAPEKAKEPLFESFGKGVMRDYKARWPFLKSDVTDGLNVQVSPPFYVIFFLLLLKSFNKKTVTVHSISSQFIHLLTKYTNFPVSCCYNVPFLCMFGPSCWIWWAVCRRHGGCHRDRRNDFIYSLLWVDICSILCTATDNNR